MRVITFLETSLSGGVMHHEIQRFLHDPADAGHPLEPAVRSSLGAAFGTDLSAVRIHDDVRAARLAAEFGVDAFAHGRDIYFAAARYRPTRPQGLRLLAHEVAHVLQQAAGQAPVEDGNAGGAGYRALEQAACRAADRAVRGGLADPALRGVPVPAAVRRPVVQFHSSFEHRALGDMDVLDILEIASNGPRRSALLQREINLQWLWHADPDSVTEEQLQRQCPGIRTLRLRGSDLLVTYGELNALPDYLSSGLQVDTAPRQIMLPLLQFVRQETYLQFNKLLNGGIGQGNFQGAVYSPHGWLPDMLNLLGESMAVDELTKNLGDYGVDHYSGLLARNACHFAPFAWHRWQSSYEAARVLARMAHEERDTDRRAQLTHDAWVHHGYADHFLQDSFAAGHLVNKTLIMQWFVEWAAGKSLVPIAEWDSVKNMVTGLQPGIAGRQLYDPDYAGGSNDPQTAEDQASYAARLARTDLVPGGSGSLDGAYQDYFTFLSSLIAQSASGAIHDYYNEHSLWVASAAQPEPYEVYGDHTLLSGANGAAGAQATSFTSKLSQQSLAELLNTGDTETTARAIRAHFPSQVKSGDNLLSLEHWNETQQGFCAEKIFPSLHEFIVRMAKPTVANLSRDQDLAVRWSADLQGSGYTTSSVLMAGGRLFAGSNGYLYELDPQTGALLHSLTLVQPTEDEDSGEIRLSSDGNRLYAGVRGSVFGIDIGNGLGRAWTARLPGAALAAVDVLADGGMLLAGSNGHVHKLDPATGQLAATLQLGSSAGIGDYRMRLAVTGSTLVVGSHGWVYGVQLPALAKSWETSLPKSGYPLVEVLVHGNQLYAGCNGFAYQLDASNGKVRRSLRLTDPVGVGDYTTTLAANDQTLFVGTHGYVYGITLADWSHAAWEANLAGNRYSMVNLALSGNQLLAGSYGYLFRIDPGNGTVVRSALLTMIVGVGRYETRVAFDPAGNHVYVGVHGYAYKVATSHP
jgi:outer membrane protein assembly factor BamB